MSLRDQLVIDSGIVATVDLAALLPEGVAGRIDDELLQEPPTAAALRLLCTLRDDRWTQFVHTARIDWAGMLEWSRGNTTSNSAAVRVELAASLAGYVRAQASLLAAATALDEGNFVAVLDALRIAREGLES